MTPADVSEPESGESNNPISFHWVASARHVNFRQLLAEHFTSSESANISSEEQFINSKQSKSYNHENTDQQD